MGEHLDALPAPDQVVTAGRHREPGRLQKHVRPALLGLTGDRWRRGAPQIHAAEPGGNRTLILLR